MKNKVMGFKKSNQEAGRSRAFHAFPSRFSCNQIAIPSKKTAREKNKMFFSRVYPVHQGNR